MIWFLLNILSYEKIMSVNYWGKKENTRTAQNCKQYVYSVKFLLIKLTVINGPDLFLVMQTRLFLQLHEYYISDKTSYLVITLLMKVTMTMRGSH